MILNTRIWNETVTAAKSAATTSPAWLRAIERGALEIEKAKYWSFDGDTLAIISTTSKKLYRVDDKHTCEARNGKCKHRVARRLMQRYHERLSAAPKSAMVQSQRQATSAPAAPPAPLAPRVVRRVERGHNGAKVVAVYCDGWAV